MPDAPLSGNARTIRLTKTNPYIRAFAFAVMGVFAVYAVLPFYWLIIAATKTNGGIVGSLGLSLPSRPDPLTNLRHLFSYDGNIFLQWTFNSFLYTAVAGAAATALSLMAGYALYIYRFPGRKLLLGSLVAVSAIPGTTLAFPLYFLIAHLKLANNLLGVFLPLLVSPFGVFLMWLYLSSTDCLAVVQAGRIDGAREIRIFRSLVAPLASPAIVTVFLLIIVSIWNNYLLPYLVLSNPRLQPVTVGLAQWVAYGGANVGSSHQLLYTLIVTGAIVFILPVLALFLVLQRYWRDGLSLGSTVG